MPDYWAGNQAKDSTIIPGKVEHIVQYSLLRYFYIYTFKLNYIDHLADGKVTFL
jgi:hypothetical protein